MKKTKFFIYGMFTEDHKPAPKMVDGYFEFVDGCPLGLHKVFDKWFVTELNTGLKIIDGRTRKEAIENAMEFLPIVREKVLPDLTGKYKKAYETIQAAYKSA